MSNDIKFLYGTKANFNALATKDANTLYFITDTLQLYKGAKEYTKSSKIVSSLPTAEQIQGIIYIKTPELSMFIYNGTDYIQINKTYISTIPESTNDNTVPTTKAVADYVSNKIADALGSVDVFVTDVTYTASTGTLGIAKGASPVNTVLTGVVNNPTYDSTTRKITLPVFGGDALVIELGKDAFVENGSYNAQTKSIDLTLTSGDNVSIPVGSLIDIYTGVATSSATVSVSSDNKISVNVKVSATANNTVTIEEDGIYVPLPDAYTKKETDDKIKGVTDTLSTHTSDTVVHITANERTAWNAKATTSDVASAKESAISTAASDATSKANKALTDAEGYADELNATMDIRVTAIESTIQWKTINGGNAS